MTLGLKVAAKLSSVSCDKGTRSFRHQSSKKSIAVGDVTIYSQRALQSERLSIFKLPPISSMEYGFRVAVCDPRGLPVHTPNGLDHIQST